VRELEAAEAEPKAKSEAEAEAEAQKRRDEEFMAELTAVVEANPDLIADMEARDAAHQAREAALLDKRPGE
jgi:hypothetical protein